MFTKKYLLIFLGIYAFCLYSCTSRQVQQTVIPSTSSSQPTIVTATSTAMHTAVATTVITLKPVFPPTSITVTATNLNVLSTPTADSRPIPKYWREWPIVPTLSFTSKDILQRAQQNPDLNLNVFSKVGDCQMTSDTFLGGYAKGQYAIPDGLNEAINWFAISLTDESITAYNGLGINSVLNPMFGYAAGHHECMKDETPLACELRINHPSVVLIGMGTNWKPYAEISFEKHLRQVIDEIVATGALPILATKADNIEEDWKINEAIAKVAYEYDLPLVNVWLAVQDLPNHGLQAPKNIYLSSDGWMRRNEAWLSTLNQIVTFISK
jgi:hypothetical protein